MPLTEENRISLRVAITMTLHDLPWRLLTGSERYHRSPGVTRERIELAAERIIAKLESVGVSMPPPSMNHITTGYYPSTPKKEGGS